MNVICRILLLSLLLAATGCSSLVSGMTSRMADDLAASILNSRDVDTVREAVPAYLLLVDSFLRSSPDNVPLLLAASNLSGSFSVLVDEPARVQLLADDALDYALRAACADKSPLCGARGRNFQDLQMALADMDEDDLAVAYGVGVAWVGWIQAHSDDWAAIGELGKAKAVMEKVIELDETYEGGSAHLYMGGLETLLPASIGGKPEKGREHFEKALAINNNYLMTRVVYAEQYGRLVFDQELHDRLLREVLAADPVAEGMTLTNKIAQARAAELLASSSDYF